ncbi:MAG: hypothetical protein ACOC6H_03665 [Thermoproteota archaeon]
MTAYIAGFLERNVETSQVTARKGWKKHRFHRRVAVGGVWDAKLE